MSGLPRPTGTSPTVVGTLMRTIALSMLLFLVLPAAATASGATDEPAPTEAAADATTKRAERKVLRQARLAAAIEDYESRYTTWHPFDKDWFLGAEVDGSYAAGPVANGSTDNFVGAFVDGSIRFGVVLRPMGDVFVNLRYVGGGSRGTSSNPDQGDGFNETWIHSLVLSLGLQVR